MESLLTHNWQVSIARDVDLVLLSVSTATNHPEAVAVAMTTPHRVSESSVMTDHAALDRPRPISIGTCRVRIPHYPLSRW